MGRAGEDEVEGSPRFPPRGRGGSEGEPASVRTTKWAGVGVGGSGGEGLPGFARRGCCGGEEGGAALVLL